MILKLSDYIKDFIREKDIKQSELAKEMNISQKHLSQLLNNKTELTIEIANKLSKVFDTTINFWINLSVNIKNAQKMQENGGENYLKGFGLDALELSNEIDPDFLLNSKHNKMLNWFGVDNLENFRKKIKDNPSANFKKFKDKPAAYVWVRECELKSEKLLNDNIGVFRKSNYTLIFKALLKIFNENKTFNEKMISVKNILNDNGIYIVFNTFIKDSSIQGFSTQKSGKKYIYLSDMHKREYNIYFSLLHELTHIFNNDIDEEDINGFVVDKYKDIIANDKYSVSSLNQSIATFEKSRDKDSSSYWGELRSQYSSVKFSEEIL